MGKLLPILGIIGLVALFVYLLSGNFTTSADLQQSIKSDFSEASSQARRLVYEFGNAGEQIAFFQDPQAPVTEWTFVEQEVTKDIVNDITGEIETVTQTELVKVKTSEVEIYSQDRQTGDRKVCKRGHQCDITGEITLIDPNTSLVIDPPYGFLMIVECETSNDEFIHSCQPFNPRVVNQVTYGDRSFKYTFVTSKKDSPLGIYTATVQVTSKFMVTDPETGLQKPVVNTGVLRVELVE